MKALAFTHATKWVLVGFIRANSGRQLWSAHARLVARVGSHGVSPRESWVTAIGKWILKANTAPMKHTS